MNNIRSIFAYQLIETAMRTTELQSTIDAENIQYKLFLNDSGTATIRVRDLDAEEILTCYLRR
jgi:hypothetical protein